MKSRFYYQGHHEQVATAIKEYINSLKEWMLQLCDVMMDFYPREIGKITERIQRFESVREYWENKEDVWTR